jgi:hypothetical protein
VNLHPHPLRLLVEGSYSQKAPLAQRRRLHATECTFWVTLSSLAYSGSRKRSERNPASFFLLGGCPCLLIRVVSGFSCAGLCWGLLRSSQLRFAPRLVLRSRLSCRWCSGFLGWVCTRTGSDRWESVRGVLLPRGLRRTRSPRKSLLPREEGVVPSLRVCLGCPTLYVGKALCPRCGGPSRQIDTNPPGPSVRPVVARRIRRPPVSFP